MTTFTLLLHLLQVGQHIIKLNFIFALTGRKENMIRKSDASDQSVLLTKCESAIIAAIFIIFCFSLDYVFP